jgi:hypothetical protein
MIIKLIGIVNVLMCFIEITSYVAEWNKLSGLASRPTIKIDVAEREKVQTSVHFAARQYPAAIHQNRVLYDR